MALFGIYMAIKAKLKKYIAAKQKEIEVLNEINNKENLNPAIGALKDELTTLKQTFGTVAEFLYVAFKDTNLPEETKTRLATMMDGIKLGVDSEYIAKIEEEVTKYRALYEEEAQKAATLEAKLLTKPTVVETKVKKVRQ